MYKKVAWFLVFGLILTNVFGCAKVADSGGGGGTTTTGTLPTGTTAVRLGASNIAASGNTMSLAVSALNQSNTAITGMGGGNFTGAIFAANPTISGLTAQTTLSAVATLTWTAVSGGTGTGRDVSSVLVVDHSGSMSGDKMTSTETAATMFLDQLAGASASNRLGVVNFSSSANVESAILNAAANKDLLTYAITNEGASGSTALFDAIKLGISEVSKEATTGGRVRAVVAMTDGGENASVSHSTAEVVSAAITAGIPVYTVGLFNTTGEAEGYEGYSGGSRRGDLQAIALGTTGSIDNYFEVIIGVTGFSLGGVASADRLRALGVLTELYQKLAQALSQSYSMSATLSNALTPGQTYYLLITFTAQVHGGGTITQNAVLAFVAQ